MLCALIGETAGNFAALDAVLNDIEEAGILTILMTGNIAAGGIEPDECVRRAREAGAICVQGTLDRHLARFIRKRGQLQKRLTPEDFAALAAGSERIGGIALEWLGTLPKTRREEIDGVSILLAHAAPDGGGKPLEEDTPAPFFARYREDAACGLIVTGGSAPAFHRRVADTLFVHPAPIGGGAQARYTIVDTDATPWRAEERVVDL